MVEGAPRELDPMIRDEMYLIGREAIVNSLLTLWGSMVEVEINYDHSECVCGCATMARASPTEIIVPAVSPGTGGSQG